MRTTGTIIGRRRVRSPTNFPKALRGMAAEDLTVAGTILQRLRHGRADHIAGLAQEFFRLGSMHPTPGLDDRRSTQ